MAKKRKRKIALVLLILSCVLATPFLSKTVRNEFTFQILYSGTRADFDFRQFRDHLLAHPEEATPESSRQACLKFALKNPGTRVEIAALTFTCNQWPNSDDATTAHRKLIQSAKRIPLEDLEQALSDVRPTGGKRWHPFASELIRLVREQEEHPSSARILCDAATMIEIGQHLEEPPEELIVIADLIEQHYLDSDELSNFCECASNLNNPAAWTQAFESTVRKIKAVNKDRFVACSAHFSLASIVHSAGVRRQEEATKLYREFLEAFDGNTHYSARSIEKLYRYRAEEILKMLVSHGLNMPAPATRGVDIEGRKMDLEEYRGKVVLISFWATWCGPCLRAIPHERKLLEKYEESGFAIFGMNADKDIEKARRVSKEHRIAWRSLSTAGEQSEHANNWIVGGYPTFYLLDRDHTIVDSWVGLPPDSKLEQAIEKTLAR